MNLRLANLKDLPQIRAIYNDAIISSNVVYDENEKSLADMEKWWEAKQLLKLPIWVIEIENTVAAYGSYGQFRPFEGFRFCAEHALYVNKLYRGKGLGKLMLQQLINVAKENNYKSMIAGIDSQNAVSIAIHQQKGFEQVGYYKNVGFKKGNWLDLVMMQKQF